jgi:chaperonin GroEL
VGVHGKVMIKRNLGHTTYTEKLEGYTFDTTLLGRQHLQDRSDGEIALEKPLFIICTDPFESVSEIEPVVKEWRMNPNLRNAKGGLRPLVIVTNGLVGGARSFVAANAEQAPIYVVQPPIGGQAGYEMLTDIQYMTKTYEVYSKGHGKPILDSFGNAFEGDATTDGEAWREFGSADRCVLTYNQCSILPDSKYNPDALINRLEERMAKSKDKAEIRFLSQRVAALSGGVGIIYVGANSDAEAHRLEHSIEDAQQACFTAIKGGVVAGGGVALFCAGKELFEKMGVVENMKSKDLEDASYWLGYTMVLQAIWEPAMKIICNYRGKDALEVLGDLNRLLDSNNKMARNMWQGWNAVSVAKQLMSCQFALVEDKEQVVYGQSEPLDERISKDSIKDFYTKFDALVKNKQ